MFERITQPDVAPILPDAPTAQRILNRGKGSPAAPGFRGTGIMDIADDGEFQGVLP